MNKELEYLKKELNTQDNLGTENPFYIVFERIKYTCKDGYSDDWHWVGEDGDYIGDDDELKEYILENNEKEIEVDEFDNEKEIDNEIFRKWHYQIIPRFSQAFLTRKGAENYIESNGHNLTDPYIYVNSMWRNEEMINIRKYFMGVK